jgi:hypothetical protein
VAGSPSSYLAIDLSPANLRETPNDVSRPANEPKCPSRVHDGVTASLQQRPTWEKTMSLARVILLVVALVVIPAWAIWHNMSDGRGNNVKPTRNRGISGERED